MFRAYTQAPHVIGSIFSLYERLFGADSLVPERLKHLAAMATDRENACRYSIAAHNLRAAEVDISLEQVAALDRRVKSECFDNFDRAVIEYARDVTRNVVASEQTYKALARFLDAGGIVELTAVIGFYNMLHRMNEPLQMDFDL